jgi:hypothetical protein
MGVVVESRMVLHVCCWLASANEILRAEVSWGPFWLASANLILRVEVSWDPFGGFLQDVRVAAVPRFGFWSIVRGCQSFVVEFVGNRE